MPEFNTNEVIDMPDEDGELKRFFARLRSARRILVNDGTDQFVVELQYTRMTAAARERLKSGPVDE